MKRAAVVLALAGCAVAPAPRVEPYRGRPGVVLEAPGVRMVVLPELAARIVHYGRGGENILWERPDRPGGGYLLDLGPENIPRHPLLAEGPYVWETRGNAVVLTSPNDPVTGMRLQKEITLDPDGSLLVLQRMKNVSELPKSYFIWDRTLCKGGGYALVPLNPKSRFPARWALGKRLSPKEWEYNGKDPSLPAVKVLDNILVAQCGGPEQKLGADADAGWIAYAWGRLLFVKYFPTFPDGRYSDAGLSVELYFRDEFTELEPVSPEIGLTPPQEYAFPEKWLLLALDREVTTHEEARALAEKIPPSPFRR